MGAEYIPATPLFGIVLTLSAYRVGQFVYKKTGVSFLHPVITASAVIMLFLTVFDIKTELYQNGGSLISFMLGPATVALALPLYRQIHILKSHAVVILASIIAGAVSSVVASILLSAALGLPRQLMISVVPKSITTPIAVELSQKIGGLPSVTALAVIFTGIIGAVTGPWILKTLRIKDPTAKGLAMGTSSHAIGTSIALEMGEIEGAVSSLSVGLTGIVTVVTAPFLLSLLT